MSNSYREWLETWIGDFPKYAREFGYDCRDDDATDYGPSILSLMEEVDQLKQRVRELEKVAQIEKWQLDQEAQRFHE